jgi:hypothetical protein
VIEKKTSPKLLGHFERHQKARSIGAIVDWTFLHLAFDWTMSNAEGIV